MQQPSIAFRSPFDRLRSPSITFSHLRPPSQLQLLRAKLIASAPAEEEGGGGEEEGKGKEVAGLEAAAAAAGGWEGERTLYVH